VLLATFAGLIFVCLILSFSPMVPYYHSKYQIRNLKSIYTCSCDLKLVKTEHLEEEYSKSSGSYLLVVQFRLWVELNSGSEKL
jgi:hypothetical protein